MGNKFIRNYIAKRVAGRSDDGIMITLSDPKKVDFQVAMMEDLLMRNGIDPRAITSENQFKGILNLLESVEKGNLAQNIKSGITGSKSARIFDLEGKEIPKGSKIMGGKAIDDDLPPPGSRGGDDDIAAPVQSAEESLRDMTEAEIKANLEAQNKKGIENILKRKNREDVYSLDDYDTTNMSDIKKEIIRTETKLGNLNPDDPGFRERAKPLVDKIEALQKKLRDDKADGGRIGLKVGTGKKFLQKIFGKEKFEEMATRDPEMYQGMLEVVDMYRKRDKEGLKMYLQKFLPHMDDAQIEDFIRGSDGSEGLVGELIRLGSGRDYAGKIEMMKRANEIRKLDNLEVTDDMIRKPNADGGIMRVGLKDGMNRRTFLKLLTGLAAVPIIGKVLKPLKVGKTVTKVPIIKTGDVPGKPEWFDQLVNKVILEGDDVTKKFATQERQVVHMKKIDDETSVTVTQDLNDGSIMVDVDDPIRNVMGESGQDTSVQMMLKKGQADETTKGTPPDEFSFTENDMRNYMDGPDDYTTEFTDNTVNKMSDLTSDLGKIKSYATGEKPTMKQIVESKKRKDMVKFAEENPAEYAADRGPDVNYGDEDIELFTDYASGGIARMLGE
jgi:hypothetical protein